ncbi:MAG: PAS domain-containing protein [Pirellulaceae bacterium]
MSDLRGEAERRLRHQKVASVESMVEVDAHALVHELEIRQIELEMQREELLCAQARTNEALETYVDLFDLAPVAYFLWDDEGRILKVNLAGAALLGSDRRTMVDMQFGHVVTLDDRATFAAFCHRASRAETKQICTLKLRAAGQVVDVRIEAIAVLSPEGKKTCRAAVIDVSPQNLADQEAVGNEGRIAEMAARRAAEEALRESEARLRLAMDTAQLAAWDWDIAAGNVVWNEQHYRMLGYEPGSVPSSYANWVARVHPEDVPGTEAALWKAMEEGSAYKAEFRICCADGGTRVVEANGRFDYDTTGQAVRNYGVMMDITERKKAEVALRRSEERARASAEELQAIVDTAPVAIWTAHDPQCQRITGNVYADTIIMQTKQGANVSRSAPLGEATTAYRVFRDGVELCPECLPAQLAVATGKAVPAFEMKLLFSDGRPLHLFAGAAPLFDARGRVRGAVVAGVDVTSLKQAEESLRQSESRFRALAEALPQIIWTADAEGDMEWFNQHWYEYTGQPEGLSDPWSWDEVAHPDDVAYIREQWVAVRHNGSLFQNEIRVRGRHGEYRWFLVRAWPLRDADRNVVRWFGTYTDIHDMKSAEAAVRQSRKDLDRAQAVGQIGSWRMDVAHNVLIWSDETYRIFGVPLGTLLTYETFLAMVHPDDRQDVDTKWKAALAGAPYDLEHRIVVDGKVKWLREKAYLEFDDANNLLGGFGISQDITERRQAEERIQASLDEKKVLLQEIHHRVKNNMQVISSLVALQAGRVPEAAMREILQDVTHRVRSMALVHEKLYESSDLARVNFSEYSRSLLTYLWRAHDATVSGIRLVLDLEPIQLSVNAAVPCGLILNELATNALKHAFRGQPGGEVAVSLRGTPEGQVCLRVEDDGVGLPAGFDWRTADSLGLHLVHMLVGQLHASVEITSDEGTQIAVTFGAAKT